MDRRTTFARSRCACAGVRLKSLALYVRRPAPVTYTAPAFQVDDAPRRIFEDADSGAEVSECAALACLSAPCQAGGTCVQDGQDWNCLCPSG